MSFTSVRSAPRDSSNAETDKFPRSAAERCFFFRGGDLKEEGKNKNKNKKRER